jgi:hypothetical protein
MEDEHGLTIPRGVGTCPGATASFETPNGSISEKWTISAYGSDYTIVNVESGLGLDGAGDILRTLSGGTSTGKILGPGQHAPPPTVTWAPCVQTQSDSPTQLWTLTPSGKGYVLQNVQSGRQLSLKGANPQYPYMNLGNSSGDLWKLQP